MIINIGIIKVAPSLEYVTAWKDNSGRYVIDQYVSSGKVIINKMVTGCGFTTYCLFNDYNTILVSPRLRLIQDKLEQANEKSQECFYFNREQNRKKAHVKTVDELKNEFQGYMMTRRFMRKPIKILVTYDSFCNLADMLEQDFGIDISLEFRIAIDESHSLIKDVKLKEYSNKCVLSQFIARLFTYSNILFISATPIIQYVQEIPEFQKNDVYYYELEWDNVMPIIQKPYGCKNATDAFDQIYKSYSKHGYFDAKYGIGAASYSKEAVVFLNSVQDIVRILNKYIVKKGLIDVGDVTIICADNKENLAYLHKVDKGLDIVKSIPKNGDPHTTWTFVTRTAFEGVDFYSPCASTYVIANYNVSSLSLDIASDIPQIVGRQRRKDNLFRDTIHIYYVNNKHIVDDAEFQACQKEKMEESNKQIRLWQTSPPDVKDTALSNLTTIIDKDPNGLYVTTVNGFPEINQLIIVSEQYCRDILKNQLSWFVIMSNQGRGNYSLEVQQLNERLAAVIGYTITEDRIRIIADYFVNYPSLKDEIFGMLRNEGYNDIAYFFNALPIERIKANGYNTGKMNNEIAFRNRTTDIASAVRESFVRGRIYSKKSVKRILQEIYDRYGLKQTAKSTDLADYIDCGEAYKDGLKAIRVL